MGTTNTELAQLRRCFDASTAKRRLSLNTIRRYRNWIRRYIKYCLRFNLAFTIASAESFLGGYQCRSTHRQGYFALEFFFIEVLNQAGFSKLEDSLPKRQTLSTHLGGMVSSTPLTSDGHAHKMSLWAVNHSG